MKTATAEKIAEQEVVGRHLLDTYASLERARAVADEAEIITGSPTDRMFVELRRAMTSLAGAVTEIHKLLASGAVGR